MLVSIRRITSYASVLMSNAAGPQHGLRPPMLISIVIPSLDEEDFIEACLESVLRFDVPAGVETEVFVLDGGSTDRTRALVAAMSARDSRLRLVDNRGRIQSSALNAGLRLSRGDYIMRLDAHSLYPRDYLVRCLDTAERTGADNVGGRVLSQPVAHGYAGALVQALTTHRFGTGGAAFRRSSREGPTETVPYGFFRRAVFDRVGPFDERLVRAQDYEMNRRITAKGGCVWLDPTIRVFYYQRAGFWAFLRKQVAREGPYNAYMWYIAPYAFAPRHAVTGAFVTGLFGGALLAPVLPVVPWLFAGTLACYSGLALGAAITQSVRHRKLLHVIALPLAFFALHVAHGLGVLGGVVRLLTGAAPVQGKQPEGARRQRPTAHLREA